MSNKTLINTAIRIAKKYSWKEKYTAEEQLSAHNDLFKIYSIINKIRSTKHNYSDFWELNYISDLYMIKHYLETKNYCMACHEIETVIYKYNMTRAGLKTNLQIILQEGLNN